MKYLSFIALGLVLLAGCQRESRLEPGVYADTNIVRYIKDMTSESVLVRVNGKSVTKADFERLQRVNEKVYRLHSGIQLWAADRRATRWTVNNEQRVGEMLLERELFRQEADRLGLVAPEEKIQKAYAKYLTYMKCDGQDIETVLAQFGTEDAALFRQTIADDIRFEMLRNAQTTNGVVEVTDEELAVYLQAAKEFNANADRLNAQGREKAMKFRQEVLAGGDFTELTKKYAELYPEHGQQWNDYTVEDLPDDWELKAWLKTAKGGDVSEPIDTLDGLSVVGLVYQYETKIPKGLEKQIPKSVMNKLVKCTFKIYQKCSEKPAEVKQQLLKKKTQLVHEQLGERLFAAAVIEYPNGVEWFPPYQVEAPKPPQPPKPPKQAKNAKADGEQKVNKEGDRK